MEDESCGAVFRRDLRIGHVGSNLNEDLGQAEDVSVEVEADDSRLAWPCHAARAEVS